jgi:hypothetical protein
MNCCYSAIIRRRAFYTKPISSAENCMELTGRFSTILYKGENHLQTNEKSSLVLITTILTIIIITTTTMVGTYHAWER